MERDFLRDKRVLVMGLGRFGGGADSAAFAARAGGQVTVTDLAGAEELANTIEELKDCHIEYHLGGHRRQDFEKAEILIINPAVRPDNEYVLLAEWSGAVITSQVELFFQMCPAAIVGITGSNGKSTTTSLTAHLLEAGRGQAGYGQVWLSGNIGNRPMLGLLDEIKPDDVVVLELSSFQIEQLSRSRLGPYVGLITNLTPNHLDRHGTFEAYCAAKEGMFTYQKPDQRKPAVSVFNAEDPITLGWYEKYRLQQGRKCLLFCADDVPAEIAKEFRLPGRANRSNLAAALAAANHFGADFNRLRGAVGNFEPLPNRLQLVAEINGVRWYDDSKATTPVSTIAALNGIEEPKILIAGGYDKGIGFEELGRCISRRVKAVVLIGKTADKIEQAIKDAGGGVVVRAGSMAEAVEHCRRLACPEDVVLMSPACASYDMFENYQHRARVFTECVLSGG